MTTEALPALRLMQLVSPALPVGAFAYSQGLEWAVHAGWVHDETSLAQWLHGLVDDGLQHLDLPVLMRLHDACTADNAHDFAHWSAQLVAARETAELRAEERARARALTKLIAGLGSARADAWRDGASACQAAAFAIAATDWGIARKPAALGYAWAWLENQVAAAVKLVPLGQTAGQRVQRDLAPRIARAVDRAGGLDDSDIGACAPAMAIASSLHETQYTRLFRS